MSTLSARTEIEAERTWRADEVRFMQNQLSTFTLEDDRERFRRSVILLLYAHFEGFCAATLRIYVREINLRGLRVGQVIPELAAASCQSLLTALSDRNHKSDLFRRDAPEDSALHFAWRSAVFFEKLNEVMGSELHISDEIVNTESNLWPVVLKKNLMKLGFSLEIVDAHAGTIWQLVNRRNSIGHGVERNGIDARTYANLLAAVNAVMDAVTEVVMESLRSESYLLPPAVVSGQTSNLASLI